MPDLDSRILPALAVVFGALGLALAGLGSDTGSSTPEGRGAAASTPAWDGAAFEISLEGDVVLRMLPVPDGRGGGFFMSETEVTWDAYDQFVFEDELYPESYRAESGGPDAVARPSKPYIPPDRGYGHEGFPAISIRHRGAVEFCRWLSKRAGRSVRLPEEDEWERACLAGARGDYHFGDAANADAHAWYWENALDRAPKEGEDVFFMDRRSQAVGGKVPNAYGLHDMHGNAAEWVLGRDGVPVLKGGSWRDELPALSAAARASWEPSWQGTDPQIPKSSWWLSDGDFAGFRVVCPDDGDR